MRPHFRIVQPWGRDKGRQATLASEHATISGAFEELDRLAAQMLRTGARTDSVELLVVDDDGTVIARPATMVLFGWATWWALRLVLFDS